MTHTEFFNNAVARARKAMTHDDVVEIMLNTIAESMAAIADTLKDIDANLDSISYSLSEDEL